MGYMPMNTAIRYKTEHMGGAGVRAHFSGERHQGLILKKRSIFYRQINLSKIHRHSPSGANIGMANFRIAHLTAGQTHLWAMGDQLRIWTLRH